LIEVKLHAQIGFGNSTKLRDTYSQAMFLVHADELCLRAFA
jgi:hypothetical protein